MSANVFVDQQHDCSQKPVIILGGGDHGVVVAEVLWQLNRQILGVSEPKAENLEGSLRDLSLIRNDSDIERYDCSEIELVNGLGFLPGNEKRKLLFEQWQQKGYRFATLVHPAATISRHVHLSQGAQVMASAVVNSGATIGENVIINSAAVVEHHADIGAHSHVAPGAVICGGTSLDQHCFIGANSTVIQYSHLPAKTVVAAGSVYKP